MKTLQTFTLWVVFIICAVSASAQVTIGSASDPNSGALLDLKENDHNGPDGNSTKGLLFPKVKLTGVDSLEPLISAASDDQKKGALGMVVYNTNDAATSGLKSGLCVWNGKEWLSIEGGGSLGTAQFDVNCSAPLSLKGVLSVGKSLNPVNNTIVLPVTVNTTGKYNIMASTNNGYYFSASGELLQRGNYNISLAGMGAPLAATTTSDLDTLTFYIN